MDLRDAGSDMTRECVDAFSVLGILFVDHMMAVVKYFVDMKRL